MGTDTSGWLNTAQIFKKSQLWAASSATCMYNSCTYFQPLVCRPSDRQEPLPRSAGGEKVVDPSIFFLFFSYWPSWLQSHSACLFFFFFDNLSEEVFCGGFLTSASPPSCWTVWPCCVALAHLDLAVSPHLTRWLASNVDQLCCCKCPLNVFAILKVRTSTLPYFM